MLWLGQTNSDFFHLYDDDSNYFTQICELSSVFLPNSIPHQLTIDIRKRFLKESDTVWQIFYLVDTETDLVAATAMCVLKPSARSGELCLIVQYVVTHIQYRKKGVMDYLLKLVVGIYENNSDFQIVPFKDNKQEQDDIAQIKSDILDFINTHIYKPKKTFFWTLSSIVSDYYSKFGFHLVPNLKIYSKVVSNKAKNIKPFVLNQSKEIFINDTNFAHYATSPKYSPIALRTLQSNQVALSSEYPSILEYHMRDKITFDYYNIPSTDRPPIGLVLTSNNEISFVLVSLNFFLSPFMIHKLYTNVSDENTLVNHLKRINKFLDWVSFSLLPTYQNRKDSNILNHIESKGTVSLTTEEVVTEIGAIDKQFILDWLLKNGWKFSEDYTHLPMLKTTDSQKETEWVSNGSWCAF